MSDMPAAPPLDCEHSYLEPCDSLGNTGLGIPALLMHYWGVKTGEGKVRGSARRNRGCPHPSAGRWLLLMLFVVAMPEPSWSQEQTLPQVLARATDYVNALHEQLYGVVMEERYQQRAWSPSPGSFSGKYQRVTLRSDYLLVRPEGSERYFGFRDVFEVNGRAVRDREERLAELFLDESSSARDQVQGILREGARYNIGDVVRNTNTPTLALLFLRPSYKPRFQFERLDDASPRLGLDGPEDVPNVWVIEFRETWPTTVVTGRDGINLPARGRFWVEPDNGRVLVTELVLDSSDMDSTVVVKYETNETLGHFVPVEMREHYDNHQAGSQVDGTATYSRFRQFRVEVEEAPPARD
jgi:hypothetical protein